MLPRETEVLDAKLAQFPSQTLYNSRIKSKIGVASSETWRKMILAPCQAALIKTSAHASLLMFMVRIPSHVMSI